MHDKGNFFVPRQELNKLGFSEPQIKGFQLMNTKNITLDINADENEINFFYKNMRQEL